MANNRLPEASRKFHEKTTINLEIRVPSQTACGSNLKLGPEIPVSIDWTVIRNLGRVKYFNISYVVLFGVPIAAEVYAKRGDSAPDFPGTLQAVYAASILFAIAITIYQFCCPSIVKAYAAREDYIAALYDQYLRANPDRKFEIVLANLATTQADVQARLVDLKKNATDTLSADAASATTNLNSLVDGLYPSAIQRFLAKKYDREKSARKWAIITSAVFYTVGSLIILVLLVLKSITVFHQ